MAQLQPGMEALALVTSKQQNHCSLEGQALGNTARTTDLPNTAEAVVDAYSSEEGKAKKYAAVFDAHFRTVLDHITKKSEKVLYSSWLVQASHLSVFLNQIYSNKQANPKQVGIAERGLQKHAN